MSTRGFLTIVDDNKNIVMAAYCPNSAYPSYQGVQVLDALAKGKFPDLIESLKEDYPEERDTVQDIQRSWYVKDVDNRDQFFPDYVYEYEPSKSSMNLFHYGAKALTVDLKDLPLYKTIFEKEYLLYRPLCFDPQTMMLKKDFYGEVRKMIRAGATAEDFLAAAEKNNSILYMDKERFQDHTTYGDGSGFIKYVRDAGTDNTLKFIVDSFGAFNGGNYSLYVQTPFFRGPVVSHPLRSAAAAEKAIADILRQRPRDVRATMELFGEISKFKGTLSNIYHSDTEPLETRDAEAAKLRGRFLDYLNNICKEYSILGIQQNQVKSNIQEYMFHEYTSARKALEAKEGTHPSLDEQMDTASISRQKSGSSEQAKELLECER